MFALRGIAVSFSVFVIVYAVLSLAVGVGWRRSRSTTSARSHRRRYPARHLADWLFASRMFPLATAAVITAGFTVPSFLLFEPRAIDEPLGLIPSVLGICGAGLGIFGLANAVLALRRVSRSLARWTAAAQPVAACAPVPVLRISPAGASAFPAPALPALAFPAMTVAGILHPIVLLSRAAESMLTASELQTALQHEVAHVRRRDNLRKLLLCFVAFPGMAALEAAWLEATEMAADDAAVSNAAEALDLAAALLKLSRLNPSGSVDPAIAMTAALVNSPAAVMNARVQRLLAWSDDRRASSKNVSPLFGLAAALATAALFVVSYSQLLVHLHTATEWLVR
jgi:Zn-dependent protease with chaperone function